MSDSIQEQIHVQAFATRSARSEAMQKQLVEILARIDDDPAVSAAHEKLESAKAELAHLRLAHTRLTQETQKLSREISTVTTAIEMKIVAGTSAGNFMDELGRKEAEHRLSTRAYQRLVERLLPQAEIDELRKSTEHLLAKARSARQEAAARIERTAKLMAEAAEFEGNITFDAANTLSGVLFEHAAQLETQADNLRRRAAERIEKHERILQELESIKVLRG